LPSSGSLLERRAVPQCLPFKQNTLFLLRCLPDLNAYRGPQITSYYRDLAANCAAQEDKAEGNRTNVAKVQVYTTTYCPFCTRAKTLLKNKGVAFEEIDVTHDDQLRQKMIELAGGRRTVPEIFINDKIIGGYDELRALEMRGELDSILAETD
jgi:glutaredoxin 3